MMADFMTFIDLNKALIFADCCVSGKLVIDGYELLHILYDNNDLDWENGGRYAAQYQCTIDFFENLMKFKIEPIVVLDGGGTSSHINQVVHRRKKGISTLPELIDKKKNKVNNTKRFMPLMAREIFASTLRENNVQVYVADGKATKTIIKLANEYKCPILTDRITYCFCNVHGGVIFYKNFPQNYDGLDTLSALIYKQSKFIDSYSLSCPEVLCGIVAVIGDGFSVRCQYDKLKNIVEASLRKRDGSTVQNVICYFKQCASFEACKNSALNEVPQFRENCRKINEIYIKEYYVAAKCEDLMETTIMKCSLPCEMPLQILQDYRRGIFPVLAINAMTLGECMLEHSAGYPELPPTSDLGLPVRELIYGLVSGLMKEKAVKEYCRSKDDLSYKEHRAKAICTHKELMITELYCNRDTTKRSLAIQVICQVLSCPDSIVHELDNKVDRCLILVTLVTYSVADYLTRTLNFPKKKKVALIQALVLNFFVNVSSPDRPSIIDENDYYDDMYKDWVTIFHILLVWTSLYRNVHSLNVMLYKPFEPRSPLYLLDGPLVIFLALDALHQRETYEKCSFITPQVKSRCDKLMKLILPPDDLQLAF